MAERKYRFNINNKTTHNLVDNEDLLVGNSAALGKYTKGKTVGPNESYVEFTWNELVLAVGGTPEPPQPSEPTTLSINAISCKDGEFLVATEGGRFAVLAETEDGRELEDLLMTVTNENAAYYTTTEPMYLGDGVYVIVTNKTDVYSGYSDKGSRKIGLTLSSSGLVEDVTVTNGIYSYDHGAWPRLTNGFGSVDFCPVDGIQGLTKQMYGLACRAVEIDGLVAKRYDETWQLRGYTTYTLQNIVAYPKNYSGEMLSSNLSMTRKMSDLIISVTPNTLSKPRVGYVRENNGITYGTIKCTIIQDGLDKRFGFFGDYLYEMSNWGASRKKNWIFLIDLSQRGKIYELEYGWFQTSKKRILFHQGISDRIKVTDGDGNVITSTTYTTSSFVFDEYKTTQGVDASDPVKFKIEIL